MDISRSGQADPRTGTDPGRPRDAQTGGAGGYAAIDHQPSGCRDGSHRSGTVHDGRSPSRTGETGERGAARGRDYSALLPRGQRSHRTSEFREFKGTHLSGAYGGRNLEIDHHPVVNVTWEEAARYCNWLSGKAGLPPVYIERNGSLVARSPMPARLPPAHRGGVGVGRPLPQHLHAAEIRLGPVAPVPLEGGNYGDQSARSILGAALPDYQDGNPATAPVGSFRANASAFTISGGMCRSGSRTSTRSLRPLPGTVEQDPTRDRRRDHTM